MLLNLVWVALGGAVGSMARFLVSSSVNDRFHPWGTVLVNIAGSLVLGILIGKWGWGHTSPNRLFMAVGLLGGFTTFSAFSLDTLQLWEDGRIGFALATVLVSVGFGIAAGFVGLSLGRASL